MLPLLTETLLWIADLVQFLRLSFVLLAVAAGPMFDLIVVILNACDVQAVDQSFQPFNNRPS
jgi:hypothetical protein